MILTENGVLKLMQRIKSFIASQLNTKANSVHTHTLSEIDDLSNLSMGGGYTKSEVDTLLTGKSDTSHTHTKSQITDFPSYGTTANTICEGNDSRLSDARTPTSHTHTKSEITNFPTLSTVATSGSYNDLSNKPTIPTVNNATLTIQQNGTTVDTFTANSSSDKTVNIQCVDLTNNQTVAGNKEFTGTTTAHDLVPSTTETYNLGTSTNKWKGINGFDVTGIGHIGSSSMDQSGNVKTYTRINPNVGIYAHYCVAPDNGWVACREHGGSGTFQVCALGSDLNADPTIISPLLNQYQFGSIPVRKGEYYAIISYNESASYTMRFIYNNG